MRFKNINKKELKGGKIMKKIVMVVMILIGIISLVFAIQGIAMHVKVNNIENKFHQAQENYFLIDKSTRDAAPANSQLNQMMKK